MTKDQAFLRPGEVFADRGAGHGVHGPGRGFPAGFAAWRLFADEFVIAARPRDRYGNDASLDAFCSMEHLFGFYDSFECPASIPRWDARPSPTISKNARTRAVLLRSA